MKTKNLISSLLCSLLIVAGQQAYANTYHPNQSNTPGNGFKIAQASLVKIAKNSDKDEDKVKDTIKDVKKDNEKDKNKNEVKDDNKDEVKNDKNDEDDGTNPLSFENVVLHDESEHDNNQHEDSEHDGSEHHNGGNDNSGNNHCKSKKSNECNEGDNHDDHDGDHDNDGHHDDDDDDHVSPVPIPGAIWLFGTALVGFISMSNRRKV